MSAQVVPDFSKGFVACWSHLGVRRLKPFEHLSCRRRLRQMKESGLPALAGSAQFGLAHARLLVKTASIAPRYGQGCRTLPQLRRRRPAAHAAESEREHRLRVSRLSRSKSVLIAANAARSQIGKSAVHDMQRMLASDEHPAMGAMLAPLDWVVGVGALPRAWMAQSTGLLQGGCDVLRRHTFAPLSAVLQTELEASEFQLREAHEVMSACFQRAGLRGRRERALAVT